MPKQPTYKQKVQAGAEVLDKYFKRKKWWLERNVKVEKIDMTRVDDCVLGQLFGGYFDALNVLSPGTWSDQKEYSIAHGFSTSTTEYGSYGKLTSAWKELITSRRAI